MKKSSNFKKLSEHIIANSYTKNWEEAKKEWKCVSVNESQGSECSCGHFITNEFYIQNYKTKKILIVGSSCVKKFNEKAMTEYVKREEKKRLQIKKEKLQYEYLKERQQKNNIPLSIKLSYLEKRLHLLNQFEYDFYMQVYYFDSLSYKQIKLKESINRKLLNS